MTGFDLNYNERSPLNGDYVSLKRFVVPVSFKRDRARAEEVLRGTLLSPYTYVAVPEPSQGVLSMDPH